MRKTCGSRTSARPSATRWRCPPESARGLRSSSASIPSSSAASSTRRSISAFGELADPEAEGEVLAHAHLRIERVVLEDHRDVALARRDVVDDALADPDRPRRERLEPGEQPQRRRLARAGRADEHHELAVRDLERELRDGGRLAEALRHVLEGDGRHQPFTAPVSMPRMKWRWRKT